MRKKITKTLLRELQPRSKRFDVSDTELKGFSLRVEASGSMLYYVRYRLNGRQHANKLGSVEVLSPAQARDHAKRVLADAARGIGPVQSKRDAKQHTIGTFIENDYAPIELAHKKSGEATYTRLKKCFQKTFWDRKLTDPTLYTALLNWRNKRLKDGRAKTTVNRDIAALKSVLSHAVRLKLIEENPLADLKPLKTDTQTEPRYLKAGEEERLYKALDEREEAIRSKRDSANQWLKQRGHEARNNLREYVFADHLKPMVIVSLYTGLRRNELFSLEWSAVDFGREMLTVRGDTAKNSKTRYVPLNSVVLQALKDWKIQAPDGPLVFTSPRTSGKYDNCNSAWKQVRKTARLLDFRWHDMRHDFASKLVMKGVDLNTVRELLGHADLKMTLRYAHLAPEVKARAVEKLVESTTSPDNIVSLP